MAFRDDKDALVERLGDLERDLKETREGLEKKDEELQRLRARLGGLDAKSPNPRRGALLIGVGVALVAVSGVAWLTMTSRPSPDAPTAPPVAVVEATPAAPLPSPVVTPTPTVPESPPPTPAPSADLTWNATVRTSTGSFAASVKPGARCSIDVGATGGAELDFHRVALKCGETVVFDTAAPMRGTIMSQTSGSLTEVKRPDGKLVYRLVYRDIGTRTLEARPQLEIGTERKIARAYHEGVLGGALDLAIDKDSQPRSGEPLVKPAD